MWPLRARCLNRAGLGEDHLPPIGANMHVKKGVYKQQLDLTFNCSAAQDGCQSALTVDFRYRDLLHPQLIAGISVPVFGTYAIVTLRERKTPKTGEANGSLQVSTARAYGRVMCVDVCVTNPAVVSSRQMCPWAVAFTSQLPSKGS